MGLREQAKLDARAILEDDSGFAWPVTLTSPLGVVTALRGFTTDVGQTIDPETGQAVAGRRASATFPLGALPAMPEAVADRGRKPWLATFADSAGVVSTWKVTDVLPDRAMGVVVLILEVFKPAIVALTGGLVLPSLQLSGSFSPSIVGALTLPSQQLTGSIAPAASLAGAPSLPSLQLSGSLLVPTAGFVPSDISNGNGGPLSAWLRVVNATLVSGDVSSLPDALNSNPAVQASAGSRPTAENSAGNALPCMRFAGTDSLLWPLVASNNAVNQWGIGVWLKPGAVVTTQMIWFPARPPASADRFQIYLNTTFVSAHAYISDGTGRFGSTPGGIISTNWNFLTVEYDKDGATEAAKLVVTVDAVARSLTFGNLGAGGTLGALPSPTGNGVIGLNGTGIPFLGLMGPNVYVLSAKMAGATVGLLTPQARLDLMNYQRPT